MDDHLVEVDNLHFRHGKRWILQGLSLKFPRGKITALMGPSGTGKTTLLKLIGAQLEPEHGRVLVDGQDMHQLSRSELYEKRQKMGLLFQSGALFTNINVFDNVAFPLRVHTQLSENMIRDLVLLRLQSVGLRGARDLMPRELSGGMARRVALARALMLDPQLMMYDEPFTGQDPITVGVLLKLIRQLNDALGLTSIIVSHDVEEVVSIADYVYLTVDGKVVGEGKPNMLMKDDSPAVKQFMHGLPDGVMPFHYPAKDFEEELL